MAKNIKTYKTVAHTVIYSLFFILFQKAQLLVFMQVLDSNTRLFHHHYFII